MIFGTIPVADAAGAVLAHTQRLPGRVLRKGVVLDPSAITALREAGHREIIAARLEPGDIAEDAAADRLAQALRGRAINCTRPTTGRVNLLADTRGVLLVDRARLDRLNAIDEALTIATLTDMTIVEPREMLATIKIIPFAVAGHLVEEAEAMARAAPPLSLHAFRPLRVGLVLSDLPGLKPSILDGTIEATKARVEGLGGVLLPARRCAHATATIAEDLRGLLHDGAEMLLVAGASAVVDRRDVAPAAIVAAGGDIRHFGMPVDPGNLICVGAVGAVPALILPGCARSPKLNGIDWVLWRLFAGLPVEGADIARMGVGGLLKEAEQRPAPRARAPAVAGVVLAAGRSSRMAPRNKLLIPDESDRPMVRRTVEHVLDSAARPVTVVLGHQAADVRDALTGLDVRFVEAPDYADGLSASLRAGIAAVPPEAAAAVICLGDMPLVTGALIDRLIAAYDPDEGRTIIVPTHRGRIGNPVLWDRRFFPSIAAMRGDAGARALLAEHLDSTAEIPAGDEGVLLDFDTPESLIRA